MHPLRKNLHTTPTHAQFSRRTTTNHERLPILQRNNANKPHTQRITRNTPTATQARERPQTISVAPSPQPTQMPKPTPKPTPTTAPAPSYTNQENPDLYKCTHCGKTFTQPLRMLNFQEEPPRIMNVCPFCNETMPTSPTSKETEQEENRTFFRKNNSRTQKPLTH